MAEHDQPSATAGWFDAQIVSGAHPEHPGPRSDPDAIARHIERYTLSGALVTAMASWLHDPLVGNAEATSIAAKLSDLGVRACWVAVPPTQGELPDVGALVEEALEAEVGAFRLYPGTHGYSAVDVIMDPFYASLTSARLPLWLDRSEQSWADIDILARRFPELSVVITGIGYRELRALGPLLARHRQILVDLVNFSAHEGVEWLVRTYGADRLLFATGLGVRDPGESIARLLWSGLDDNELAQICAANVHALLGARR